MSAIEQFNENGIKNQYDVEENKICDLMHISTLFKWACLRCTACEISGLPGAIRCFTSKSAVGFDQQ